MKPPDRERDSEDLLLGRILEPLEPEPRSLRRVVHGALAGGDSHLQRVTSTRFRWPWILAASSLTILLAVAVDRWRDNRMQAPSTIETPVIEPVIEIAETAPPDRLRLTSEDDLLILSRADQTLIIASRRPTP